MTKVKSGERLIIEALQRKACTKQSIYRTTLKVFDELRNVMQQLQEHLSLVFEKIDKSVETGYRELGRFESELKFGSDILYFTMHTNVFAFEQSHEINQLPYIKEDPMRGYFGMITVHNFLADSIKYNRQKDLGYLIARIFINRDRHFFVDGERPLDFLYKEIETMEMNEAHIKSVLEACILFAIDFDLYVPPYKDVREVSVEEKLLLTGNALMRTAKRLGFQITDTDKGKVKGVSGK